MSSRDTIFLINDAGELEQVPHRLFSSEELFQTLIEQHPELLVGEQIDPDTPPRWLLIQREAGIPGQDGGGARWSVDHLLLDQHGRPTFVEVKRSSDTRIRREVVGQMLDYAANAVEYWPKDRIRELAVAQYGGPESLNDRIRRLVLETEDGSESWEPDDYWASVDRHLQQGELRLLFVADQIPTELRRIIEFLNEKMPSIEVLGVEIRQYEGQSIRALVPRVVGQTEYARQTKSAGKPKAKFTKEGFLELCKPETRRFFEELLEIAGHMDLQINWGTTGFSMRVRRADGTLATLGYGVRPHYYENSPDDCFFQASFHFYEDHEEPEALREALLQTGAFTPNEGNSLDLFLERTEEKSARVILGPVLEKARTLQRGR